MVCAWFPNMFKVYFQLIVEGEMNFHSAHGLIPVGSHMVPRCSMVMQGATGPSHILTLWAPQNALIYMILQVWSLYVFVGAQNGNNMVVMAHVELECIALRAACSYLLTIDGGIAQG